jgi:FkbM family methyltransferase
MKTFQGFRNLFQVTGNERDRYYAQLPDHDLGALCNYFFRLSSKRKIRVCLDVGANIGLSALVMSEIEPKAHIYSFEPSEATFASLSENIERARFRPSVTPIKMALGKERGVINFVENETMSAGNHISLDADGIEVPIDTVDNLVETLSLTGLDFVKIDVEGFETDVVEGALKSIFSFRPTFFLEYNEYALRYNSKREPVDVLTRLIECLGPLGVVNPQTGDASLLPADGHGAYEAIRSMTKSDIDVFDLVTESV